MGIGNDLESFSTRRVLVQIRMKFEREFPKGFLDFVLAGGFGNSQRFVVAWRRAVVGHGGRTLEKTPVVPKEDELVVVNWFTVFYCIVALFFGSSFACGN